MPSKNDYKVLYALQECTNELKSYTIDKLHEVTKLSVSKIRLTMREFKGLGFVKEGALQHNAKTYYITQQGLEKIKALL
jgi:DNA-binding transcriptional regulator GbsR (MarR family)